MKELFDIIDANKDICICTDGASDELILLAEEYLCLKFPESYKLFLKKYGVLGLNGEEIYGIVGSDFENSSVPDAIWLTKQEHEIHPELKNLVFIYFTGDEFYFCLDTGRMKNGECPVVSLHVSGEGDIEDVHDNFAGFLTEVLDICFMED